MELSEETTKEQWGTAPIQPLNQAWRIVALAIYVAIAWLIYFLATGTIYPTGSGASVWLLAAMAYWLLTLVAAPFFLPPRDSLSGAIAVVVLLAPLDFSNAIDFQAGLGLFNTISILVAVVVATTSLIAIFKQNNRAEPVSQISYRLSTTFGKGEVLFTPAVIISTLGFYQGEVVWMFVILGFWTLVVSARPVELLLRVGLYLKGLNQRSQTLELAGTILRIDDPNIIRVTLVKGTSTWQPETVHIAHLPDGKTYYVLPLFAQIQNEEIVGTGLCCPARSDVSVLATNVGSVYAADEDGLAARLGGMLSGEEAIHKVVGIVVERSSIADIRFQVVHSTSLEEGMVVYSYVREKKVYYQILDAQTNEESFQQNPYGIHIVSASQLGCYDPERGFQKFPWLPNMNQPLFLAPSSDEGPDQKLKSNEFLIGRVPYTSFGIPVILDDLIEYHTAVLGITGTGKTELTLDIVRSALNRNTKVFCVDFTGEYKARLADYKPVPVGLTIEAGSTLEELLLDVETGEYGAKKEKLALQKFIGAVKPSVAKQIEEFLTDPEQRLGIFELAEITNTKATLRTTELYLSAIMDWARQNRKAEQILIVLEEAHTIIPEAYGSGFDSETQWVVSRIGQIALQGRKYGVGLLLVSQRTALVSKTVLSQCNTYFTHALVDKTSLDYLSGVYSAEHIKVIPNLRFLEFLAYGKGIKSERPLLAKRDFDPEKVEASRALDAKRGAKFTKNNAETR